MEQSEKNLSELVDIRDVVIDKKLTLEERVKSYVEQIKDPYCFFAVRFVRILVDISRI